MAPDPVDEHTFTTPRGPVYYRSAPAAGVPRLFLHGIPTSSDDWLPFLEHGGGVAPDLIGFGRSSKGGHLDYSLDGLAAFVAELLDQLGIERVSLVAHQWGAAVGATLTARHPERVERLTLLNPVPLINGHEWRGVTRWLRRPVIGELLMGATTRRMLARVLRRGAVTDQAWSAARLGPVWEQFDQGTQRAILRLHRGTSAAALEPLLGELRAPAQVLWGDRDPWFGRELGDAYAARLGMGEIEHLDAGHWPWLDRPELVERLAPERP